MTRIIDRTPPAPPYEADSFAGFAQRYPEPLRNLLAAISHQVEIEGRAMKVGALERSRMARAKQLALLGQIAATRCHDEGPAGLSRQAQEVERSVSSLRAELSEMMRCGIDWTIPGDMIGPERFVFAWKRLRVIWRYCTSIRSPGPNDPLGSSSP